MRFCPSRYLAVKFVVRRSSCKVVYGKVSVVAEQFRNHSPSAHGSLFSPKVAQPVEAIAQVELGSPGRVNVVDRH